MPLNGFNANLELCIYLRTDPYKLFIGLYKVIVMVRATYKVLKEQCLSREYVHYEPVVRPTLSCKFQIGRECGDMVNWRQGRIQDFY